MILISALTGSGSARRGLAWFRVRCGRCPGAQHRPQPGLRADDLRSRVLPEVGFDLPLHGFDLDVHHVQNRDERVDAGGVRAGHDLGLAEVVSAQCGLDDSGLISHILAVSALQCGADLRNRQPGGLLRGEGLASSSKVSAASRSSNADRAAGK